MAFFSPLDFTDQFPNTTKHLVPTLHLADTDDEPVKEVQKPKPVNINKKTKVAEKLKKKSQRDVVSRAALVGRFA